ncbi:MAG: heavy metal-responsive transcriptional regulator [Nitrospinales bacterium]
MKTLTRSELAKKCGVNIETLRFYEKRGLIDPARSGAGYRLYSREDEIKIVFIKNARNLGFTLPEIEDLLNLNVKKKRTCKPVLIKTREKLGEVEEKIKGLNSMRKALTQLIGKCENSIPTNACPILDSFDSGLEV